MTERTKRIPNPSLSDIQDFIAASNFALVPKGLQDRYRMALGQVLGFTPTVTLDYSIDDLHRRAVAIGGLTIDGDAFGSPATALINYTYRERTSDGGPGTFLIGNQIPGDGTTLYSFRDNGGPVQSRALAQPFALQTLIASATDSATLTSRQRAGQWALDGSQYYSANLTTNNIEERAASTPFDVTTLAAAADETLSTGYASLRGVAVDPTGLHLYAVGASRTVEHYEMSTAFDLSTATLSETSSNLGSGGSEDFEDVIISGDGLILTFMEFAGLQLLEFDLGTAWDVSTAVLGGSLTLETDTAAPIGVSYSDDYNHIFVSFYGAGADTIVERYSREVVTATDSNFASVALLADFDGSDADTAYTEQSANAQAATFHNTTELTDTGSMYGPTSLNADTAVDDGISFGDNDGFKLGSSDFTIEFDYKPTNTVGANAYITYGRGDTHNFSWDIEMVNGDFFMQYSTTGASYTDFANLGNPGIGSVWRSIIIQRDGATISMYSGGVLIGTYNASTEIIVDPGDNAVLMIGNRITAGKVPDVVSADAQIDNVRITHGVARASGSTTPIAFGPYPTS